MKSINVLALCMVVTFVSFLGFIVENVWLAITKGYIDNRNMCFPFLLGYGLAMVLIYIILGTPSNMWFFGKPLRISSRLLRVVIYYLAVMLCISVGEILLGTLVEHTCGFSWWDYSKLPMHITKYTSIPTSAMFAIMVTLFMEKCLTPMYQYFSGCNTSRMEYVVVLLMSIMVGDFVYSAYKMYKTRGLVRRWRIETKERNLYKRSGA